MFKIRSLKKSIIYFVGILHLSSLLLLSKVKDRVKVQKTLIQRAATRLPSVLRIGQQASAVFDLFNDLNESSGIMHDHLLQCIEIKTINTAAQSLTLNLLYLCSLYIVLQIRLKMTKVYIGQVQIRSQMLEQSDTIVLQMRITLSVR